MGHGSISSHLREFCGKSYAGQRFRLQESWINLENSS